MIVQDDFEFDFFNELRGLIDKYQASQTPTPSTPQVEESIVSEEEVEDRRNRSKKVYFLSTKGLGDGVKIPDRPSACRRVVRYLKMFEVGTVKQMAHSLNLEKKTIGNALSELGRAKIVSAAELPTFRTK